MQLLVIPKDEGVLASRNGNVYPGQTNSLGAKLQASTEAGRDKERRTGQS